VAVHPFARKCEAVIAHLREILVHLRRAKESAEKGRKPGSDDRGKDFDWFWKLPQLLLLGSPEMENQASVFGSERGINSNFDKQQPKPPKLRKGGSGDPQEDRLRFAVELARYKCNLKQIRENKKYFQCLASKGGSAARCKPLAVPTVCPDLKMAFDALHAYQRAKNGRSGGGGGGGF
jgi:hypothetical protein